MRPEPKYVIEVANQLEAAKSTVERLQKIWDGFFPEDAAIPATAPTAEGMRENSAISRTLEFINSQAPKEFGSIAIAEALGLPVASTRTNLAKLYKQGKVSKRGDGLYRALGVSVEGEAA